MKASKTGLAILVFVLMAIILMVAFGGRPYGQSSQPQDAGTGQAVTLRKPGSDKPLSPASSAIVSNKSNLPTADSVQLPRKPVGFASDPATELPKFADAPPLKQRLTDPFASDTAPSDTAPGPVRDQVGFAEADSPTIQIAPSSVARNPDPRRIPPPAGSAPAFRRGSRESLSQTRPQTQARQIRTATPPARTPNLVDRPGVPRQTPQPPHEPPKQMRRFHRIIDGDSLPAIAGRYLGDPQRYLEIFEANRKLLLQPDLLPLGVRLEIPPRNRAASGANDIRPITPEEESPAFGSLPPIGIGRQQPQSTTSPTPTHSPIPKTPVQDSGWRHVGDPK